MARGHRARCPGHLIEVGTGLSPRSPLRTGRADLPHPALQSVVCSIRETGTCRFPGFLQAKEPEVREVAVGPTKLDLEEARRELTGGAALDPQQELLESVPESERWEPVLVSTGHEALTFFDDGEDDEGRSASERLFEEGVEEAEHDQMLQAATARTEAS